MKKIILILNAFFSFYCAYGASTNGTIVAGYYIVQDFEGSTTLTVNKSSNITATVFTPHPANSTYCTKAVSTGNNGDVYFTFPVSLPTGINLANFDTILYDFYIGSASYKKSYIYI